MVTFPQPWGLLEPAGRTNDTVTSLVYQCVLHGALTPPAAQFAVMPSARAAAGRASATVTSMSPRIARLIAPSHAPPRPRVRRSGARAGPRKARAAERSAGAARRRRLPQRRV